jgi:hypothetical protein
MHSKLPDLAALYADEPRMKQMLNDVDVYLSVAEKLLNNKYTPSYPANRTKIDLIYKKAMAAKEMSYDSLFTKACIPIDWSRFNPSGHYVDEFYPQLANYFRTMMWLGRIEFRLAPVSQPGDLEKLKVDNEDLRRQIIDALLLVQLFDVSHSWEIYHKTEEMLKLFVGEQDNIIPDNIVRLKNAANLAGAKDIFNDIKLNEFVDSLKMMPVSQQKIVSQVLTGNRVNSVDSILPVSSFMLFGQRFVVDSYIMDNVVFDKIRYNKEPVCRLFPSTLDPMFVLGNDAAARLLSNELNKYHYSSNLAALRYLIDSFDKEFWNSSLYNSWLNMIRRLNPPAKRDNLPEYMQTAAYWQSKLNTQLAAWTQLRHDNLLYAKHTYTEGGCFYPHAYLEPIPEFYRALKTAANKACEKFKSFSFKKGTDVYGVSGYFHFVAGVMDTLTNISEKILSGKSLSKKEDSFLKSIMYEHHSDDDIDCGALSEGWYPKMFFQEEENNLEGLFNKNCIVADFHTTPADCDGTIKGWVKHTGTGKVNMGVYISTLPSGKKVAFVGPSLSYHEYTTTDFRRLSDQEWDEEYLQKSLRPDWVNIYLADSTGESRGNGISLLTSVQKESSEEIHKFSLAASDYSNANNPSTIMNFNINNSDFMPRTYTSVGISPFPVINKNSNPFRANKISRQK